MLLTALSLLRPLTNAVAAVFETVCVVLLAGILGINALEIVARTFFAHSFHWIYETNLALATWVYFLGMVVVYWRGGDITMLMYQGFVPARAMAAYRAVLEAAAALAYGVTAWFAWELIELQWPFRTPGMGLPTALYTLALLLGLVGLVLFALRRLAEVLAGEAPAAPPAPSAIEP